MIEARDLTKRYGSTLAVDRLSFTIRPGTVTGFLGPNGSGKSTTMRLIMGLDTPDAGQARIGSRAYRLLRWPLREVGAVPAGRYGFRHATRMEWIKLRSLRSTTWVLAAGVVATIALGAVAGFNTRNPHGDPTNNVLAGIAFGQVVFGVLGVLTVTGEYSSGMIRATLAAIPRRPLVLAAKAVTYGLAALAAGQAAAFGSFLTGTAVLRAAVPHPALSQPTVLRAVAMTGAYLALIGLMGLGLGAIIRNSAAAVATLTGGLFVLPLLVAGTHKAGQFLPELIAANSLSAVKPVQAFTLSPWTELGIVAAYAAALLGAGCWSLVHRDA